MPNPSSWKRYHSKAKKHGHTKLELFSRFASRYSMALEFESLSLSGTSKETSEAYVALLRVMLSYSALEVLESALGSKSQIAIFEDQLSSWFRQESQEFLVHELLKSATSKSLSGRLTAFRKFEHDDLRPMVEAIRNLMAHGTMSASRLKLNQSKVRRERIDQLATVTLEACDERFTKYVNKYGR